MCAFEMAASDNDCMSFEFSILMMLHMVLVMLSGNTKSGHMNPFHSKSRCEKESAGLRWICDLSLHKKMAEKQQAQ